jgi:hypothetical protein
MLKITRFVFLLSTAASSAAVAQNLPAAETVLDRYVESTGGKAAHSQVKNILMKGKIEFAGQGLTGTLSTWSAAPASNRTVMELAGIGKIESGSSGGRAWQLSAMQGPRILEGDELKQNLHMTRFNSALTWRDAYSSAVNEAEESIDGKTCYRLVLTPKSGGTPEVGWYDKDSGLIVRTRITLKTPMGELAMDTDLSDFRAVSGVKFPFAISQKVGPQAIRTTIEDIQVNADIPASQFDPPAEIQKLMK